MIGEGAGGLQCVFGADARHACHTTRAPSHARSRRNRAAAQSTRLAAICKGARIIEGAWLAAGGWMSKEEKVSQGINSHTFDASQFEEERINTDVH